MFPKRFRKCFIATATILGIVLFTPVTKDILWVRYRNLFLNEASVDIVPLHQSSTGTQNMELLELNPKRNSFAKPNLNGPSILHYEKYNQSRVAKEETINSESSDKFRKEFRLATRSFDWFKQFQHDWCRVQEARLNWEQYLAPCRNFTVWGGDMNTMSVGQHTNAIKSYITDFELQPAGLFSRFFIQSVTRDGKLKSFGGDSWRIHLREGPSSLAPTVFDLLNGTYEVLFLVLEPGIYRVDIILDYTLCHGFKDPPPDWFMRGEKIDIPFFIKKSRGGFRW